LTEALECCTRFGGTRFILFSGVAGAGKTRMAGIVGRVLSENDQARYFETQFHESYAYEDFVEGLMPTPAGGFEVTKRIFRLANDKAKEVARQNPRSKVVLVIEEFSRANLSNVLGEVFTYVEHRGRHFQYPLSGDDEFVAENLVVIGTMNPLDRSVVEMDDALIRRTRRVAFTYSEASLRSILLGNQLAQPVIDLLAEALRDIAPDLPFAHGVFVDVKSEVDLFRLWTEQLEQFFVKPSGQKHPKHDAFRRVFPWTNAGFRVIPAP
jgi:5-methylcytosine-specific restriction endonuclease McrBC GTP-binding regulatory subunit McrB